jgi:hypothetical protein
MVIEGFFPSRGRPSFHGNLRLIYAAKMEIDRNEDINRDNRLFSPLSMGGFLFCCSLCCLPL